MPMLMPRNPSSRSCLHVPSGHTEGLKALLKLPTEGTDHPKPIGPCFQQPRLSQCLSQSTRLPMLHGVKKISTAAIRRHDSLAKRVI